MTSDFGLIDNDTVLQAVLARRAPDVHRQIRNEFGEEARAFIEFPGRGSRHGVRARRGSDSPRRALLADCGGRSTFHAPALQVPSWSCSRGCSHITRISTIETCSWCAGGSGERCSSVPRSSAATPPAPFELLNRAVKPGDLEGSIQRLLDLIPQSAARVPDLKRFRSNEAATKLVLCSWWSLEPRSLTTGQPFGSVDLAYPSMMLGLRLTRFSMRVLAGLRASRTQPLVGQSNAVSGNGRRATTAQWRASLL